MRICETRGTMERCSSKTAPMLRTLVDELTTSSPIVSDVKGGLGGNWEEQTVSSDLSRLRFSLLPTIHISISPTQASRAASLSVNSICDKVLEIIYNCESSA